MRRTNDSQGSVHDAGADTGEQGGGASSKESAEKSKERDAGGDNISDGEAEEDKVMSSVCD